MSKSREKNDLSAKGAVRGIGRQEWLPGALLACFMLMGILLALRDVMAGDICLLPACVTGGLVILACMGLERDSRAGRIGRRAVYAAGVAGFLLLIGFVARGFLDAVNRLITLWNLRFDTEGRLFQGGGDVVSSAVFWSLLAIPLSALLADLIRKRRSGLLVALLSAALLFAFAVGRTGGWGAALLLGAGILGTFFYVEMPARRLQARGALCMLLAGVLVLGLAAFSGNYGGSPSLSRWKRDVKERAERFRYGEDSLPRGELDQAPELLAGEEDRLQLSMERPQEMYLRGFVGTHYEKDRWAPLRWADYQESYGGIWEWLKARDFLPSAQYARYEELDQGQKGGGTGTSHVEVDNVGAYRKYAYLPGSVSSWNRMEMRAEKDAQFRSEGFLGSRRYTFDMADDAPTAEQFLTPLWVAEPETEEQEEYCDTEAVYHAFVEDTYLEIDGELEDWIREEFFPNGEDQGDFAEINRQIRRVLRAKAEYTKAPAEQPADTDLIPWFLEEAKAGNAVYFATAAVMAYRTAGYPARYVEGYHLKAADAVQAEREGKKTAILTGQDAHAWVEVYLFGAGWLPVEVTPGMYTETYTEQIVEGTPTYQIGVHKDDEGLSLEEGENRGKDEQEEEPPVRERIPHGGMAALLLALYLLFFVFLLLEAQRALRIALRRRGDRSAAGEGNREAYALEGLLQAAGVKGSFRYPLEMEKQVEARFPGIAGADYRRAVGILQKERFGGHALREGEKYTLQRFLSRLRESLYRRKGWISRLRLRYWYAVERGE